MFPVSTFLGNRLHMDLRRGVGQKMPCATSLCIENEGGKGAEGQVPPPCPKVSAHGSISSADHFMTPAAGVHILLLMSSRPVQQS